MDTVILIVNSIILGVVSIILSYNVTISIDIKKAVGRGLEKLNRKYGQVKMLKDIKKYSVTISLKMGTADKIELYLIDKSNIRHYLPFVNFYTLLILCGVIFIIAFQPIYRILFFIPSAVIVSFLFSLAPVLVLDLMGRYNSEKIRRNLAEFVSVLNRWCAVKEDIFYAFEKSMDSGMGEPLKTFIKDMVIQVKRGIDPIEALDILHLKVDSPQFKDFIINIKQNIKHRGHIRKLLTNLEDQFYRIEEEYNRRKISTYKDRILIYIIMFSVIFIAYYFLKLNAKIEQFYLGTLEGKLLLTIFCVLYTLGLYFALRITQFKH